MQVNSLVKSVKIKHIAAVLSAVTIVGCSQIPELPTELPGPISLPEQPAEPAATPPTPPTPQVQAPPAPQPRLQQPNPQLEPILPPQAQQPIEPAPPAPIAESSAPVQPQPTPQSQLSPEPEVQLLPVPQSQTETQNVSLPRKLDFTVLHKANYNPLEKDNGKSFKALITAEIYNSELLRHSVETPKSVNFGTSQVLASSAGQRPSGGYTIGVTEIEETEDRVIATVVQVVPGPGCITTPTVSFPYEFVVVPSRKPIEIFERQRTEDC